MDSSLVTLVTNFFKKPFVNAACRRALKTVAQTAASLIGVNAVMSSVDWQFVVSSSLLSGVLSILTSISTGLPEVPIDGNGT